MKAKRIGGLHVEQLSSDTLYFSFVASDGHPVTGTVVLPWQYPFWPPLIRPTRLARGAVVDATGALQAEWLHPNTWFVGLPVADCLERVRESYAEPHRGLVNNKP